MRGLVLLGVVCLWCAGVLCPVAYAEDAKAQARQHFETGRNRYDAGEFAEALAEFKEAFRLKDDPALLFNMGQCHSKLGDDAAAVHAYRAFLRRKPDAPNRALVETRIAEAEERLKKSDIAPQAPPTMEPAPVAQGGAVPTAAPAGTADGSSASGLNVSSASQPSDPAPTPMLKTWWFWTGVGAVVVGGVTTAILLSRGGTKDGCSGESLTCVRL